MSAEVRGPRSAAALEPKVYLSQAYYISLNPLSAFRLTLLFDVLFYLTFSYKIKAFFVQDLPPLGLEEGLLSLTVTLWNTMEVLQFSTGIKGDLRLDPSRCLKWNLHRIQAPQSKVMILKNLLSDLPAAGAAYAWQTLNFQCLTSFCAFSKAFGGMSSQTDLSCWPAGKTDWDFFLKYLGQNKLVPWRRAVAASSGLPICACRYRVRDCKTACAVPVVKVNSHLFTFSRKGQMNPSTLPLPSVGI